MGESPLEANLGRLHGRVEMTGRIQGDWEAVLGQRTTGTQSQTCEFMSFLLGPP